MSDDSEPLLAETAIEEACRLAGDWYRALPPFEDRVNLGSVFGFKYPALLSEQDCVIHFARFLNEAGVPWESMHHQVSASRWLLDHPHPAATAAPGERKRRWTVDLALLGSDEFLRAKLPAVAAGFRFDAFIEFSYLHDSWTLPGANPYGFPARGRAKVQDDVAKIDRYLERGVCSLGYVVVFEEANTGFPTTYAEDAAVSRGCRVRFVRGYETTPGT